MCCGFKFNYAYILIYVGYFSDWHFGVLYRIILEKGDDGNIRGGKNQNTAHTLQVTTAISNSTALVETNDNHTGRAKQSSPMGESIKSLANQLLGSRYFEQESDDSETDSEEYSSESMVEEDVRTPPKLKSQLKHKQNTQHVKIPPKRTEIPLHSQSYEDTEEVVNHKGVAVPVIIEDEDDVDTTIERLSYNEPIDTRQAVTATTQQKKSVVTTTTTTTTSKPYYETTSSDGVSTWVLLSGSSSSTTPSHLTNKGKTNKPQTSGNHKTTHITPASELLQTTSPAATKHFYEGFGGVFGQSTIEPYHYLSGEGVAHVQSTVNSLSSTRKPVRISSLPSPSFFAATRPQLRQNETLELLKLSKTRKPNPVTTNKTPTTAITTTTTTTTSIPTKLRPVDEQNSNQKTRVKVTTVSPIIGTADRHQDIEEPQRVVATTENETASSDVDSMEDSNTDKTVEITTKNSRRPPEGNKKRKKNKNRRRRPSQKPEIIGDPESKTDEVNATSANNKVVIKERPLSTRIYNYLAREVMPSVGVGLLGLVVTAGLAGLIMYPFGGGLAKRRTYEEELPPNHMNPNTYYHHGQYEGEIDNSQSEEEVFGKLLEGMNDKGEFTYSGIGEETTGYAGVPGIGGDQDSGYKTGSANVGDGQTYSSAGVGYGGGRINDNNIARYDSTQQGAASYTGAGNKVAVYPYSYGSQQNYGNSVRSDNTQDVYQYSGMATRSGEAGNVVRESQHLYSGNVNAAKQHYTVGSVHDDGTPLQHAGAQVTAYGGPYYTSSSVDSQPYTRNPYGSFTAVGVQTHGNVRVDSKAGSLHLGSTERVLETKQRTVGFTESISSDNEQYRRGTSESRQQHRDFIGTQPRSGGTVIAVSVTRQPDPQAKKEGPHTKQSGAPEHIQTVAGSESVSIQPTQERRKNVSAESEDSSNVYGEMFDTSSGVSPGLQKRGSLTSGRVEHGPRSLRSRRDTSTSTNFKVPDGDVKDNEIYSSQSKESMNKNDIINLSQKGGNKIPTHIISENVMTFSGVKQIGEGILNVKGGSTATEKEPSTINGELTTGPTEETKDVLGNESQTESTTPEYELPTTTDLNNYDTDGEDVDIDEEEVDEYVTTSSPEITTVSNETSIKDADVETATKDPEPQFSLLGLVRRIARFKIRMGLSLLRSTSQAFTNYIEGVQRRMEKNYNSYNNRSVRANKFKKRT